MTKILVTFDVPISSDRARIIVSDALHSYIMARVGKYGSAEAYVEERYPLADRKQKASKVLDVKLNCNAAVTAIVEVFNDTDQIHQQRQ